jgi:hypothetical protein
MADDESSIHAALCRILRDKKVTANTASVASVAVMRTAAGQSARYVIVSHGAAADALAGKLTEITGSSGSVDAAICVWAISEMEAFALLRDEGQG